MFKNFLSSFFLIYTVFFTLSTYASKHINVNIDDWIRHCKLCDINGIDLEMISKKMQDLGFSQDFIDKNIPGPKMGPYATLFAFDVSNKNGSDFEIIFKRLFSRNVDSALYLIAKNDEILKVHGDYILNGDRFDREYILKLQETLIQLEQQNIKAMRADDLTVLVLNKPGYLFDFNSPSIFDDVFYPDSVDALNARVFLKIEVNRKGVDSLNDLILNLKYESDYYKINPKDETLLRYLFRTTISLQDVIHSPQFDKNMLSVFWKLNTLERNTIEFQQLLRNEMNAQNNLENRLVFHYLFELAAENPEFAKFMDSLDLQ